MGAFHCASAWLGGEELAADVLVEEESGTIVAVHEGVAAPRDAHRFAGVVLPGLANAHSHAFHRALRGRGERARGSFWSWRELMYDLAGRLDPESLRELALAAFAEMACAGYTAVGEFHYLHFDPDGRRYGGHAMEQALAGAARDAGVRLTLLDACYLEGGPGEGVQGVQHRFADGSVGAWCERVDALADELDDEVVLGAAIHSLRAVPPEAAARVAAWAAGRGAPLHAHVSEQQGENEAVLAAYSATPTAALDRAGALGPGFTAVHATHLTASDRSALGRSGSSVCICPTTERHLADGIVELTALRGAGARVCLGSDSQSVVDPFEEQRCLEGHERLRSFERATMTPGERLTAAATAAHHAIGRPRGGALRPGAPCDLVHIGLRSVRLAGTGDDPLAALAAAATAADVVDVVVGGAPVVEAGRHRRFDVAELLERSVAAAWS